MVQLGYFKVKEKGQKRERKKRANKTKFSLHPFVSLSLYILSLSHVQLLTEKIPSLSAKKQPSTLIVFLIMLVASKRIAASL